MADWRSWRKMALDSRDAAQELESRHLRSCISRIYYSAYQAITAVLIYSGCQPPPNREAWSHELTPNLAVDQLMVQIKREDARKSIRNRLRVLYNSRVAADYYSDEVITSETVRNAMKFGNYIVRIAMEILPGE